MLHCVARTNDVVTPETQARFLGIMNDHNNSNSECQLRTKDAVMMRTRPTLHCVRWRHWSAAPWRSSGNWRRGHPHGRLCNIVRTYASSVNTTKHQQTRSITGRPFMKLSRDE